MVTDWRGLVTPARRGKGIKSISNAEVRTPAERHTAMTWAQRLKRVFNIDIEACSLCAGPVRVIASIEDQDVIDGILSHLRDKEQGSPSPAPPDTTNQSATCHAVSFRGEENRVFTGQSAGTPLNDSWHRFLCASVREWPE